MERISNSSRVYKNVWLFQIQLKATLSNLLMNTNKPRDILFLSYYKRLGETKQKLYCRSLGVE